MTPTASRPASAAASRLDELLDDLANRIQAGQPVDIEAFARENPAHASELRRVLPAMQVLAGLPRSGEPGASATGGLAEPLGELGDYRLIREVGRGGMGVVYEAEQMSLRRRVALKVLPWAAAMDPKQLQRFKNEALAAASLKHDHIVSVYAVGCERGVHYYAMEFIDGQTLAEVIPGRVDPVDAGERGCVSAPCLESASHGALTQPRSPETAPVAFLSTERTGAKGREFYRHAAELIADAADALEHAHGLGIVHRDVKPGNLLLDGDGKLYVSDFGLARFGPDAGLTMSGDLLGTLRYMAPEQALARHGLADHRVDVYGLGATLYELLTGRPAVGGEDKAEIVRHIAFEEPVSPRKLDKRIPAELETITLKCLAKNPNERYVAAGELATDLRRFLADKPVKAKRPTLLHRSRAWARRHKAVVVTAAVGLFLASAVLAGGVGWVMRDRALRDAKTRTDVQRALNDATGRQAEGKWAEALAAVRVAEELLAQGYADRDLKHRVEILQRDLRMVQRLEDIWLGQSNVDADGTFSRSSADAKYAAAFNDYGIEIEALSPEDAARRVEAQAIRVQLVIALDDWTRIRRRIEKRGKQHGDGWRRVVAVARAADSDDWRNRVRDELAREVPASDRARGAEGKSAGPRLPRALADLAASEKAADQPSTSVVSFAMDLAVGYSERNGQAEAIALLRNAQRRHPSDFWINFELGELYHHHSEPSRYDEAIRFYTVAIALRPECPVPYLYLCQVLTEMERWEEAAAAAKERIRLKPGEVYSFKLLSNALSRTGPVDEAIAACREGLRLNPTYYSIRATLTDLLVSKGQMDEAAALWPKPARPTPSAADDVLSDHALAYDRVGVVLRDLGRFDNSLIAIRRCHELGSGVPGWQYPSAEWVREAEQLVEMDRKLPAVLAGAAQPADASEQIGLAVVCQGQKRYAAAARFYADGFAADPKVAEQLHLHRYNAACDSALAGCSKGTDAGKLDGAERSRLRQQALDWLTADLVAWTKLYDKPADHLEIQRIMNHWQRDYDFEGVRAAAALAKLPKAERAAWQKLWAEVAALLKRREEPMAAGKPPAKP